MKTRIHKNCGGLLSTEPDPIDLAEIIEYDWFSFPDMIIVCARCRKIIEKEKYFYETEEIETENL